MHCLVDRLLNKLLDKRLAPGVQHSSSEATAESADTGEADPVNFVRGPFQNDYASLIKNVPDQFRLAGFEIMISKNSQCRNAKSPMDVGNQFLCFFGEPVIGQISAEQEHIRCSRNFREGVQHRTTGMLPEMDVGGGSDAKFGHRITKRNRPARRTFFERTVDAPIEPSGCVSYPVDDKGEPLDTECAAFYKNAMELLRENNIDFLLGGAYALEAYTGLSRHTKDLDLFLRPEAVDRTLALFEENGYVAEKTFPHWLAKIHFGGNFTDLIYAAGNGLCDVDDSWFARARDDELLGLPVKIMAPEELIWMKAFIQERERYDGADVAHLIQSCAESMDWDHLRGRFDQDWRVLFSHLVLFGYIYPSECHRIPASLMEELTDRLGREQKTAEKARVCRGTLLSRAQYLPDVDERGYRDARLDLRANMTVKDIEHWTAAIEPSDRARVSESSS